MKTGRRHVYMKSMLCILLGLVTHYVYGQARYDANWTFGDGAGLHFDSDGSVTAFQNETLNAEACATISDSSGSMLFYFGNYLDNFHHNVLSAPGVTFQGGDSIYAHASYTNGAVFLPLSSESYLLFHLGLNRPLYLAGIRQIRELHVTQIQKTSNGVWTVVAKNQVMDTIGFEERITAIKHADGKSWWLLLHGESGILTPCSNSFYRFLIRNGHILGPWKQEVGTQHCWGNDEFGETAVTSDGEIMAQVSGYTGMVEIYEFNRCSGELSAPIDSIKGFGFNEAYGLSFSPNDSLLYISEVARGNDSTRLFQYNLSTKNLVKLYDFYPSAEKGGGQLEIAPNGKIYMGHSGFSHGNTAYNSYSQCITVINQPNEIGFGCDLQPFSQCFTDSVRIIWGLPNFPNYNLGPLSIYETTVLGDTAICLGDTTITAIPIGVTNTIPGLTYHWLNDVDSVQEYNPQALVKPTQSTWYYLEISDTSIQGSCTSRIDSVYVEVRICTGIDDLHQEQTFKLYPNPSTSVVNLEWLSTEPAQFKIYDLIGKLEWSESIQSGLQQVDVSGLGQGIYIYTLTDGDGRCFSGKLVLQK